MKKDICLKVPGRICLFGDHQDYLGLPVIACAIDRNLSLTANENNKNHFLILLPDINEERMISLSEDFNELEPNDLFGSALKVLRRNRVKIDKGYDISITSAIPINAGISSSSAMIISWIQFLLITFDNELVKSKEMIAKLAYEAEVLEVNSPGGNMDQISIAIGGIVLIDTKMDLSYKNLNADMSVMILGESGIPKDTSGMLSHIRSNTQESFDIIKKINPNFISSEVIAEEILGYLKELPDILKPYFRAAINNHLITQKAKEEFDKEHSDLTKLGSLMSEHHQILKNDLGVTIPRIDSMIEAALDAGAFGAKIVGSGGGGCIVALAKQQNKEAIINAMMESGAKDAYEVSISNGVTFDDHA